MKHFMTLALCCALSFSFASETFVGLKAGAVFSAITSRDDAIKSAIKVNQKIFVGPTAGLAILFRLNNYVALQPEFNFRMVGNKHVSNVVDIDRFMQVEVPIMVKAGYGTDKFFVYGSVGPYVAVHVAGKKILEINDVRTTDKIDFKTAGIGDGLQRVDVGLSAGAGGMYIMKKGALDIEFRYNAGLLGQFKNVEPKKSNAFWRSFAVSVAYVFRTSGG